MLVAPCLLGPVSSVVFSCRHTKCQPAQSVTVVKALATIVSMSGAAMGYQQSQGLMSVLDEKIIGGFSYSCGHLFYCSKVLILLRICLQLCKRHSLLLHHQAFLKRMIQIISFHQVHHEGPECFLLICQLKQRPCPWERKFLLSFVL